MVNICTSPACFLAGNGGLVSLPLITLAGLVDSLNPCAIAMIILLLTYLVVFGKRPERVLPTGLFYIGAVFATYLVIGLIFYQSFSAISQISQIRFYFNKALGSLLILAGLINIKDFFLPLVGPHLEIPSQTRPFLKKLTEKVSYPAAALLGIFVTILETPCSLPIYVGTANILAQSGLTKPVVLLYFFYYNFLFILPLLLILILVWKGSQWRIIELQDFQHKSKKWMKLSLGALLLVMGIWLILW